MTSSALASANTVSVATRRSSAGDRCAEEAAPGRRPRLLHLRDRPHDVRRRAEPLQGLGSAREIGGAAKQEKIDVLRRSRAAVEGDRVAADEHSLNPGAGELLQQLFEVDREIHRYPPPTASRLSARSRRGCVRTALLASRTRDRARRPPRSCGPRHPARFGVVARLPILTGSPSKPSMPPVGHSPAQWSPTATKSREIELVRPLLRWSARSRSWVS